MNVKRRAGSRDWLPLSKNPNAKGGEPTGEAFRTEWIDFERGIRVGNLEPHERITQILKHHLEGAYGTPFVIDRWGRGVYWQWICWLPRANRQVKPFSHSVNFGCAKLFISVDRKQKIFQSGLQVERGHLSGPAEYPGNFLGEDWDWHRLIHESRKNSILDDELHRLILKEGFTAEIGDWEKNEVFTEGNFSSAVQIRNAAKSLAGDRWGGFQLYYPMPVSEVKECSGYELVKATQAVFGEVIPAMNRCMQVKLEIS